MSRWQPKTTHLIRNHFSQRKKCLFLIGRRLDILSTFLVFMKFRRKNKFQIRINFIQFAQISFDQLHVVEGDAYICVQLAFRPRDRVPVAEMGEHRVLGIHSSALFDRLWHWAVHSTGRSDRIGEGRLVYEKRWVAAQTDEVITGWCVAAEGQFERFPPACSRCHRDGYSVRRFRMLYATRSQRAHIYLFCYEWRKAVAAYLQFEKWVNMWADL